MFFDEAQTAKINKFFKSEKRPEVGKFGPNSKTGAVHTTRPYPGLVIRRVPIRYTFYTRGDDAARVSSDGVQTCNVLIRRAHKSLESTRPGKRKRKKKSNTSTNFIREPFLDASTDQHIPSLFLLLLQTMYSLYDSIDFSINV